MANPTAAETAEEIEQSWHSDRWAGVRRAYTAADVFALKGSIRIRHTTAEVTAEKLWRLLRTEPYIETLGAMTGNQAVQMVRAGLKAIYLSGWQVAADANLARDNDIDPNRGREI